MKSVRLIPIRRTTPVCSNFEDAGTVRRFEKAMRMHRAFSEPFVVTPREDRIDSCYEVAGVSGGIYMVDIVDGSIAHDTCTCPDFLTNDLGTCKHLEAVRRVLVSRAALQREWRGLPRTPAVPTITVIAEGQLRLKAVGRWSQHQLERLGLSTSNGDGIIDIRDAASLTPGRTDSNMRIVHAAVPVIQRILTQRQVLRRQEDVRRLLADGKIGVDILTRPLFPYQHHGVQHLASTGRALLADDMGLGKTVQAIAACEVMRARGEAGRIVIVTMASLKHQWAKEIERYTAERAVVVGGGMHGRRIALESDAPYKILNYELTWRELPRLQDLDADILILDEAQRAKNFRTKTAATLRAIPSRFLFILTGTPIENRLDDLYSLMQLVDPNIFGPLWKFNVDFHKQNPKGRITGYKNLSRLRERIRPVVLRRRKEDVLHQLPPLTEQTRYTPLTQEQIDLEGSYRMTAAQLLAIAERRPLRPEEQKQLQAALLKARQACNALELCDPRSRTKASPKLDEFEELISEIASQGTSKVLVFSEWMHMLALAAERLDKLSVGYAMLHGDIPTEKRPALLDRFRQDESQRVLLSTDAGGVGLNLQVANYVIHLDLPWNPARLDQRTSRAHRLGQTRGVFATYLCSECGIERGIEGTLSRKREVRSAALDATSTVEDLDTASFSAFMQQLREVLQEVAEPGEDIVPAGAEQEEAHAASSSIPVSQPVEAPAAAAQIPAQEKAVATFAALLPGAAAQKGFMHAHNRIKLAKLVLEAGFGGDAVRASYEALSAAISGLLDAAPKDHAAIVAAIYRDLIPQGRLPQAAPATFARIHDLTMLESQGIDVDPALAQSAVAEAEEWVTRLTAR